MNLEEQSRYLKIISDDFEGMVSMLNNIKENITQHPVYTQLEFIKPLKAIIFEAWKDSNDENNEFLNNYNGGDGIEIN